MNTLHLKRNLVAIIVTIIASFWVGITWATSITLGWCSLKYFEDLPTHILFGFVSVYFCYRGYLITRCVLKKIRIMIFSLKYPLRSSIRNGYWRGVSSQSFSQILACCFVEANGICEKDEKLKGIYVNIKTIHRLYKVS